MNRRQFLLLGLAPPLSGCAGAPLGPLEAPSGGIYTLASGDKLRVIVFGQDNLSNVYPVDGAGRIAMPLIGTVPVSGQSTAQVERTIEAKLRTGFVREPKVSVDIEAYRPFFILGEVTNSGQFPFVSGMTVQTAVAIAGGFTPRAVRSYAEITRLTPRGPVTGSAPITDQVRPGDTIVIKERWF
jgi:polysaccharide export outer membrane protein